MSNGAKIRSNRFGQTDDPSTKRDGRLEVPFDVVADFSNDGAAVEWASVVIASLPVGLFLVLGGVLHLQAVDAVTGGTISDTFTLSASLGTTATADNTPTGDDVNLATHTALNAAVGGVASVSRGLNGIETVAGAAGAAPGYQDNSDGSLEVNLNLTLPDANISGVGSLRVRGLLVLDYCGYGVVS